MLIEATGAPPRADLLELLLAMLASARSYGEPPQLWRRGCGVETGQYGGRADVGSRYLQRLRSQSRRLRRDDPGGRVLDQAAGPSLLVGGGRVLATADGVSLPVLAGALDHMVGLRDLLVGALVMALVTLLVRISSDVIRATREP